MSIETSASGASGAFCIISRNARARVYKRENVPEPPEPPEITVDRLALLVKT